MCVCVCVCVCVVCVKIDRYIYVKVKALVHRTCHFEVEHDLAYRYALLDWAHHGARLLYVSSYVIPHTSHQERTPHLLL